MRSFLRRSAGVVICGLFAVLFFLSPATAVSPRDRILILISLDGFRWDYLQKFNPPHLTRLAADGVRAERLISAFPSLTFPNHYTIVTGLWPEHHGIIGNNFYDPAFKTNFAIFDNPGPTEARWWGGEPIWVTAIKQGRVADCVFWPGSEAAIQGVRPTEWKVFDKKADPTNCVDVALGWLAQTNQRPSLITLYFHQTDTVGHHDGPDSPQMVAAVAQVDNAIGRLVDGIHRLKLDDAVNLVIVSDHGMTEVSTNRIIALDDFVDLDKVQVDFSGAVAGLRPLDGNTDALYGSFAGKENHFHVYRRENIPERFHFREGGRIPPVILLADEGWYISKEMPKPGRSLLKATHGFDPQLESMGAIFIATGPAFRHGVVIPPVENVNIYNLLCDTLGLKPAPNDGDDRLMKEVLAK
ncbi:MAG: ectonucleotide pyrophosphatase/phosphodiesterase [Limisphaerales bacterium]